MTYYVVIGRNGVAITDTWEKAMKENRYLRHTTTHKFDTFEEAEDWILTMFANWFPRADPPLSLKLNWAYFVKKNYLN